MSKPIKIVLAVPRADDPTSYYRAFGPFADLRKNSGLTVDFMLPSTYSWATMGMADIFFMQRPADPACLLAADHAKSSGTPLWVDFDDDNLAVPETNETIEIYGRWDVKDAIIKCARAADVITVSTEHLKKKYLPYNKNIVVVENAVDPRYLHFRNGIPKRKRDKVIAWRSGPGFAANIEAIVPHVVNIAKKNPTWKFIFMGHKPIAITKHIKNFQFINWVGNFMDYLRLICQLHATSYFYNMELNDHSLSRSHVAWLEAAFAESGMLAMKQLPNMNRPGVINYESPEQFETMLQGIMNGEFDLDKLQKEAWDEIQAKYTLTKVNEKRVEVISQLLGGL